MLERQRLIRASYLKTREEEREMFCQISCNDIAGAMARYTDNVFGNHPADIFLRRMRAVTGSMSHCAGAARKARQRMFAMTAALGLPCVMFIVTPEDGINFRIRVMFKGEKGSETPPNFVLDEETLRVDGGSVMYCTCYVSKNTEKEDNKHFADAAKHMVKNMQQQMVERKELLDLELEEEASSVGLKDLNISADEDGSVFLKSSVSNYLCRPKELEEVCVYDFESQYVACKPVTGSLEWAVPHPNNDHLKLNGCYLERWRKVYQDGKLSKKHEQFLMNIQDCRNSMNGGRPVDMIERLTVKPVTSRYNDGYDVEEEDGDDILNEAMDQFFLSKSLELGYDNEFRDSRGRFQCQSVLTRCHGSHRCGKNLVVCPNVQSRERFIVVEATETRPSETNETDFSTCNQHLNVKALNELALKVVTRVVDKNGRATKSRYGYILKLHGMPVYWASNH
ncbi:hypothetical protein IV203_030792 [Nitzschia inconspicua]|uniref:Uncharacterized protein n=1 Tax=Nitzschia inconspicua TaxID=303405 RepID=A0A9K3LU52_9STRA|nr:hypothetical protein IV203_030792 [Nitzschia inconspicua]